MQTPTTMPDIYCKQCGYDLRASGEAMRCPECGRAFSPDDPKTFRPRPFAAEWKRAMGRWAKRLAILLLVLGVLLAGLWGWFYWGWKQEQAALAQIRSVKVYGLPVILGGAPGRWLYDRHIAGSFVLARVLFVELSDPATETDLRGLRNLPRLEGLMLRGTTGGARMASLRELPRLRCLAVPKARLTAAGLEPLRYLPHLAALDLSWDPLTDAGMAKLVSCPGIPSSSLDRMRGLLTPAPPGTWKYSYRGLPGEPETQLDLTQITKLVELRQLYLMSTPVADADLVYLETLRALESLDLEGTRVTDSGLVHLTRLAALRDLNLENTRVTDAGLVHLEKLRRMETLNLYNTQVTDAGLVHLEKLTSLKNLRLWGTKVTPAGKARLQAALPGCRIVGP